jgi:hypothetical protein
MGQKYFLILCECFPHYSILWWRSLFYYTHVSNNFQEPPNFLIASDFSKHVKPVAVVPDEPEPEPEEVEDLIDTTEPPSPVSRSSDWEEKVLRCQSDLLLTRGEGSEVSIRSSTYQRRRF